MKIILPAGFITMKLTGTFIDFMLGLSNSNVQEELKILNIAVSTFGACSVSVVLIISKSELVIPPSIPELIWS